VDAMRFMRWPRWSTVKPFCGGAIAGGLPSVRRGIRRFENGGVIHLRFCYGGLASAYFIPVRSREALEGGGKECGTKPVTKRLVEEEKSLFFFFSLLLLFFSFFFFFLGWLSSGSELPKALALYALRGRLRHGRRWVLVRSGDGPRRHRVGTSSRWAGAEIQGEEKKASAGGRRSWPIASAWRPPKTPTVIARFFPSAVLVLVHGGQCHAE